MPRQAFCDVCMTQVAKRKKLCDECHEREYAHELSLIPTKKARCGHYAHNYFTCEACAPNEDEEFNNLYGFCQDVIAFDLTKLGEKVPAKVQWTNPNQRLGTAKTVETQPHEDNWTSK